MPALGLLGARRGDPRPRDQHLRGLQEGARHPLRGHALQVPWPLEHRALAAGAPGLRPGRRFTARPTVRVDVRARAAAQARNPDDIKVLFVVSPVLGTTEGEALARKKQSDNDPEFL